MTNNKNWEKFCSEDQKRIKDLISFKERLAKHLQKQK